jgi:hypothetical protein
VLANLGLQASALIDSCWAVSISSPDLIAESSPRSLTLSPSKASIRAI